MKTGLIGSNISKSHSPFIHNQLGLFNYELITISSNEEFLDFLKSDFRMVNVTMPYKTEAFKSCNELSLTAKHTQVVNTLVKEGDILKGFNTDFEGFKYLLQRNKISVSNKVCVILGTGATSRTVASVLESLKAKEISFVSRDENKSKYTYSSKEILSKAEIIINTTPEKEKSLLDFSILEKCEVFIDVNYRPFRTQYLVEAKLHNIKGFNGLAMLVKQAAVSDEICLKKVITDQEVEKAIKEHKKHFTNLIISGHPASGKTSVGREVARKVNKEFVDLDSYIEKAEDRTICDLFSEKGVEYYRTLEDKYLREIMLSKSGIVLSLGGGTFENIDLAEAVCRYGYVINLTRDIDKISLDNSRPLSTNKDQLNSLIEKRNFVYQKYSDITIENNSSLDAVQERIIDIYESICD